MPDQIVLNRSEYQRPDGYVNATKLCQSAGKLWGHYADLKGTKAYVEALSASIGMSIDEIIVQNPNAPINDRHTWIHPELAIDLAKWISVEYRIQVNRWMVELHQHGQVTLDRDPIESPRRLPPVRDALEYVEGIKALPSIANPMLRSILEQRMMEELSTLGSGNQQPQTCILTVRARQLGIPANLIGNGSQLGKHVAKRIPPLGKQQHGRYEVNVFPLSPEVDDAILDWRDGRLS